jgi:SNF2 family DNA or RNA helicase
MPQVKQFNAGGLQWMIGNASTGGMGYTMMASEINVFYNNTFKMVDRVQAEDRAYGHGQTKSPAYVDIVAEKTIDTTILKALEQKQNLADFVRGRIKHLQDLLDGLV